MSLVSVFSGNEIVALAVKAELEINGIIAIIKNEIQATAMAGFWSPYSAVDVLVNKKDVMQAKMLVERVMNNG
ncbi:putative signal transducing protein [Flavobacterium oreochromis]|uniref:DUF2007 domain-containing protein n=2 Tax=Flavobacterium TaxID=237 RepID=A0A246GCB7_9FLAO|nr:DUF2007 domain-containing protein [Flavobacterium oreochromis]OWP78673.1 hypothetical protein BWK62_04970 [Flavobacterium oreochromis]POR26555.1 hypothetical protein BWK58_05285 [Flavobacterium columnare]QYS85657.1 DUF2007 domain-containing protein [Flavobacterium oreochromis]